MDFPKEELLLLILGYTTTYIWWMYDLDTKLGVRLRSGLPFIVFWFWVDIAITIVFVSSVVDYLRNRRK